MKKIIITLFVFLISIPVYAIEVYNNGEGKSVDLYGSIRGYIGYGYGLQPKAGNVQETSKDTMFMGLQPNTRVGLKFKMGNYAGQVELGANEKTLYTNTTKDTLGIRHIWASYTSKGGHKILAGKTNTLMAIPGYISDVFEKDNGMNGYGASLTGSRRFQIAYSYKGFTIALYEDDTDTKTFNLFNQGDLTSASTNILHQEYTPHIAVGYDYKSENLTGRLALTYTAINGQYANSLAENKWATVHAFGVMGIVKAKLLDNRMWVSAHARYGMNEDLYGEAKNRMYNGGDVNESPVSFNSTNGLITVNPVASVNDDGSVNNISRISLFVETGYKLFSNMALVAGAGYQGTFTDANVAGTLGKIYNINSYGVFLQAQYSINKYFKFIPQVSYYGNNASFNSYSTGKEQLYQHGLLFVAQFKLEF